MKVTVMTPARHKLQLDDVWHLRDVKRQLLQKTGIPIRQQLIYYRGRQLKSLRRPLQTYNVREGGTLYLVKRLSVCGCLACRNSRYIEREERIEELQLLRRLLPQDDAPGQLTLLTDIDQDIQDGSGRLDNALEELELSANADDITVASDLTEPAEMQTAEENEEVDGEVEEDGAEEGEEEEEHEEEEIVEEEVAEEEEEETEAEEDEKITKVGETEEFSAETEDGIEEADEDRDADDENEETEVGETVEDAESEIIVGEQQDENYTEETEEIEREEEEMAEEDLEIEEEIELEEENELEEQLELEEDTEHNEPAQEIEDDDDENILYQLATTAAADDATSDNLNNSNSTDRRETGNNNNNSEDDEDAGTDSAVQFPRQPGFEEDGADSVGEDRDLTELEEDDSSHDPSASATPIASAEFLRHMTTPSPEDSSESSEDRPAAVSAACAEGDPFAALAAEAAGSGLVELRPEDEDPGYMSGDEMEEPF